MGLNEKRTVEQAERELQSFLTFTREVMQVELTPMQLRVVRKHFGVPADGWPAREQLPTTEEEC